MRLFIECILYSLSLGLIVTVSQIINPRLWVNDYPLAIQKVVGEISKREKKAKIFVGIPFILIMIGYPIISTIILKRTNSDFSFLKVFLNIFIISTSFNLFDLIILDWLIFSTIKPKYLVFPGTENMSEYSDYMFHAKASLKGLIITVIYSLFLSIIFTL
ncbi:MAG: hypothetical protein WC152_07890 [Candidatus Izemoplasmatales bacterium]